jgi:hypothetical protein
LEIDRFDFFFLFSGRYRFNHLIGRFFQNSFTSNFNLQTHPIVSPSTSSNQKEKKEPSDLFRNDLSHRSKLAVNLNAEESPALGGALYGSYVSGKFKSAKPFKVEEVIENGLILRFESQIETEESDSTHLTLNKEEQVEFKKIEKEIWKRNAKSSGRRTISFKKSKDFGFDLDYEIESDPSGERKTIQRFEIGGFEGVWKGLNLTEEEKLELEKNSTVKVVLEGDGLGGVKVRLFLFLYEKCKFEYFSPP